MGPSERGAAMILLVELGEWQAQFSTSHSCPASSLAGEIVL